MKFKNRGLFFNLILSLFIIISIIRIIEGYISYNSERKKYINTLFSITEKILNDTGKNIANPIYNFNHDLVNEILKNTLSYKDYSSIVLKIYQDVKKQNFDYTIYVKENETNTKKLDFTENIYNNIKKSCFLCKSVEIIYNKEELGIIELYITDKYLKRELNKILIRNIGQSIVMTFVIIFVVYLILLNMIKKINNITKILYDNSTFLNNISENMLSKSENLKKESEVLSSSSDEIHNSITDLNSNIKASSDTITKLKNQIDKLLKENEKNRENSENLKNAMLEIDENNKKLKQITKNINDIAFQTSILALNASVEAAKAGEYGKGFNVISDQVRNLANKSASFVKNSEEFINDIKNSIDNGSEVAMRILESIDNTFKITKDIINSLEKIINLLNEEIIKANQVSSEINNINQVIKKTKLMAMDNSKEGQNLNEKSKKIRKITEELEMIINGE